MDPYAYDESAGSGEFSIIAGVDEAGRVILPLALRV
jgi:hypothetical protein